MFSAFGWVLFGFAVWGLCILMHTVQKRFAPEWNNGEPGQNWWDFMWGDDGTKKEKHQSRRSANTSGNADDQDINELKRRIEVLEAIVTDRRYQFDEELRSSR